MNRRFQWLLIAGLALIGVLWLIGGRLRAAQEPGTAEDDRVASLEARVETLEQELAALKQQLAAIAPDRPQVILYEELAPPEPQRACPRRERQPSGEINGMPYYVVPLNSGGQPR